LVPRLVEIPILDTSTQLLKNPRDEIFKNLKSIDPVHFLTSTNIDLATRFTPEMRQFIDVLIESNGRPVLFHCTAGKDRTGFAAAIILRILGVLPETVMQDYLLTNQYYFPSHRWRLYLLRAWKGKQVAATVTGMLRADHSYLSAGFQTIDNHYGSFEEYVRTALKLTDLDVEHLGSQYLE
jgi:protein-tyrosine phosphatase